MSNRTLKIYRFLFVLCLFITSILLIIRANENIKNEYDNNVSFGTISINNYFDDDIIKLTGTYRYIENKLLEPDEIKDNLTLIKPLNIYKNGTYLDGESATILLTINNYSNNDLALQLNTFIGRNKIYVNGSKLIGNDLDKAPSKQKNIYIPIANNENTELLIQLTRNDFFIFGFSKAPVLGSYDDIITSFNTKQFNTIFLCIVVLSLTVFLIISSLVRNKSIGYNFHIFILSAIGIVICARIILVVCVNFGFLEIKYTSFIKYKDYTILLVSYLLLLFTFFISKQDRQEKIILNIISAFILLYFILTISLPVNYYEQVYKTSLLFILLIQFCSFYIAYKNIMQYQLNGIFSFVFLSIHYILIFTIPNFYIDSDSLSLVIAYAFCSVFCFSKISFENHQTHIKFKYLVDKQKLLNEIFEEKLQKTEQHLAVEKNIKNQAIKIFEESKKRELSTGLLNRLSIYSEIETTLNSLKENQILCLLAIDIDNLKYINNAIGYTATDKLILDIANICISKKTNYSNVGRWAGGTFIYMIKKGGVPNAQYIAESIRKDVENLILDDGGSATVTIGIVSVASAIDFETVDKALSICLEKAKSIGKNYVYTDTQFINNLTTIKLKNEVSEFRIPYTGELF